MRYKLIVEYDGSAFVGWQTQGSCASSRMGVQDVLEKALSRLIGGDLVRLHVAGRTDAGVHAIGQVAHVDLPRSMEVRVLKRAVNALVLPFPVSVLSVENVPDSFHARFDARMRHYAYVILNRDSPTALCRNRVWFVPRPLDAPSMQEAANHLLGFHDFTTFRAASCQARSPLRTLSSLDVIRRGDRVILSVSAPSFLQYQVRSIVGSLKKVGEGSWSPADVRRILVARNRKMCGPLAPACGLYLTKVDYASPSQP